MQLEKDSTRPGFGAGIVYCGRVSVNEARREVLHTAPPRPHPSLHVIACARARVPSRSTKTTVIVFFPVMPVPLELCTPRYVLVRRRLLLLVMEVEGTRRRLGDSVVLLLRRELEGAKAQRSERVKE